MTPTETVQLVAIVAAACPAMRMEDSTPDVWHAILNDLDAADAQQAVISLARTSRWIAPADIAAEVKRIREDRLARTPIPTPTTDPDDAPAYRAEFHAKVANLADHRDIRHALTGPPTGRPCPPSLRDPVAPQRVAALAASCPHCHAVPGAHCTIPGTRQTLRAGVHPARIDAAAAAQTQEHEVTHDAV